MAAMSATDVDRLVVKLEKAYRRVEAAQGSLVKLPSAELDLLSVMEQIRNAMQATMKAGNRDQLKAVFGGACTRTARIRAVLDSVHLSTMNAKDQRLLTCMGACVSVEQVLHDLGLGGALKSAQEHEKEALAMHSEGASPSAASSAEAEAAAEEAAAVAAAAWEAARADAALRLGSPSEAPARRPLCHAKGIPLCRANCGKPVAPGVTRHGKPFDTCCRGCAMGQGHGKLCGRIDPSKVGPGLCKMGCGTRATTGRDSSGQVIDTCCRGCAHGKGHDEHCGQDVGAMEVPYLAISEGPFFQTARRELGLVRYNEMLESVRLLNRRQLTVPQCLEQVRAMAGPELEHLCDALLTLLLQSDAALV